MGHEDTPEPQRAISERTAVRMSIVTFLALIGGIIGAGISAGLWAAAIQADIRETRTGVRELRAWARRFDPHFDDRYTHDDLGALDTGEPRRTP